MSLSFRQVVEANKEAGQRELISNWSAYLLYRWPGILLAWGMLKTALTPSQVTAIALGCVLAMPVAAGLLPLGAAVWTVFALAFAFQVLDCTDGSMARASGRTTASGARYDFLVDMFQWGVLYASMGILADRLHETGALWTMAGFSAGWLRLFARICNDRAPKNAAAAQTRPRVQFFAGLSGLIPLLVLSGPYMHWAVLAVLVYAISDVIDALTRVIE